jgi:hypothetical protein
MAKARGNLERLQQVGAWLVATFPTPFPVEFRFPKRIAAHPNEEAMVRRSGYYGDTERRGRKIIIRIAVRPSINRFTMLDTLLHEFAHAVSTQHKKIEDRRLTHGSHDDVWALTYGKIYRRFYDEGGAEASSNY